MPPPKGRAHGPSKNTGTNRKTANSGRQTQSPKTKTPAKTQPVRTQGRRPAKNHYRRRRHRGGEKQSPNGRMAPCLHRQTWVKGEYEKVWGNCVGLRVMESFVDARALGNRFRRENGSLNAPHFSVLSYFVEYDQIRASVRIHGSLCGFDSN